jgi:hypothetical protein
MKKKLQVRSWAGKRENRTSERVRLEMAGDLRTAAVLLLADPNYRRELGGGEGEGKKRRADLGVRSETFVRFGLVRLEN